LRDFKAQPVMLLPVNLVFGLVPLDARQSHTMSVIQYTCSFKPLFCVYMKSPGFMCLPGMDPVPC
jgi:hypothetical protein